MDFTILADESTDDGDRSQLAIFVCVIGSDHRLVEHFLGITRIAISKTAAAIIDIISKFLISKETQPSYIRFCSLDGTNSMSSERCGLQRLIKHSLPHAEYITVAVITGLHCALFIYLKHFRHSYHLILCSFLYGSCLSTVPSRKKFSMICNVFMS